MWRLFRNARRSSTRKKNAARPAYKPQLEALEDRLAPAITGFTSNPPGVISGQVFIDTNNNGVQDAGELILPGMTVTLSGTTSAGAPVNVNTVTDAAGGFTFFQLQPGTYSLSGGALSNFLQSSGAAGNLGGSGGASTISNITLADGQAGLHFALGVPGLVSSVISLRLFLNITTVADIGLPSGGSGFTAADRSVQPSTAASPGVSSLAGLVLDSSNHGLTGVEVTLTGVDSSGRAIITSTTTNLAGAYQFSQLLGGTYTINVTNIPAGFRAGLPGVGTLGGFVFRNDQISAIEVGSVAAGTDYKFNLINTLTPDANASLSLVAELADDTAGPAGTASDKITSDPSILGSIHNLNTVVSFTAGFDATPVANFLNILGQLKSDGRFYLNRALVNQIAGGTLSDGQHTLHLRLTDSTGQSAVVDVGPFTLNTVAPTAPTLHLDSVSDPGGTGATSNASVTLQGVTAAGASVVLKQLANSSTQSATANGSGAFSFNVTLTSGPNDFTVQAFDVAGNTSFLKTFFVKNNAPVAVPTSAVSVTAPLFSGAKNVDLSSTTLFTDADFSSSLVTFNTSAGPLTLLLSDTVTPQTVANFFNYVLSGAYANDFFHRLDTSPPVLQGGGFIFDPNTHAISSIATNPAIPNEFSTSNPNVPGTIAMAKLSGDPNSATSQFFFNLADNSTTLGASNNGGFTVFGKVATGADQRVLNTLAAMAVQNKSSVNSAFNVIPLQNYTGTAFPTDATAANFALISSASVVRRTETLSFSVESNSASSVVTASINNDQLVLTPVTNGSATITVKATDRFGASATVSFNVAVPNPVTNPGVQASKESQTITPPLQISVANPSGGTLSFSAAGLPPGLSINSSTGVISGTIADNGQGAYAVTVTATSGSQHASQIFNWNVSPFITIASVSNQTTAEGASVNLQVTATAPNSPTITFSATGLPPGLSMNSSGLISGTINAGASTGSPYSVDVAATDGTHTSHLTFTWTVTV